MNANTANAYVLCPEVAAANKAVIDKVERRYEENHPTSVIAPKVLKCTLGFREAARLMQIARETGATIRLTVGARSASADSMLALLSLALTVNTSVVLSVKGGDIKTAFEACVDVLDGKVFG